LPNRQGNQLYRPCIVTKIEKTLRYKEVALSSFVDIQGAFDNTGFESIRAAAVSTHIDPESVEWIIGMLERRIVTAGLGEEQVTVTPLLWSLVVDKLLNDLDRQEYEVIGFADDLVIAVRGNNDSILSERMQSALSYIIGWCKQSGLSINPAKTIVIPFTRRRKLSLKNPVVSEVKIEFSKETKYLGVVLDSKLLWNSQKKRVKEKAIKALMACRGIVGQRWALWPAMMR
jgi:Reverse transcriptase (RNA-dependent DNA polymerase)